ncbi:MAG: TSUP family transporter [Burkholderiales bacterium]|nr:TSUP family transporter [Burkholderiales bacterium]
MLIHLFQSHQFWLMFFLLVMGFLAGFIDAIAGGGGLISIPALMLSGIPMATVLGTNKLQSAVGTSIAVYKYYTDGLIDFLTVYRGLIMGFIGAICGAITVNHVSNQFMQFVVPFLMLGVFLFNVFNKNLGINSGTKRMSETVFFSVFGFVIGFYDAFFGPGTGNFWIIAIVFFLGFTFLNASGYAKVLNLKSNLFALAVFLYYGQVNFTFALIMAVGQIFGGYLGAHMVISKGSKFVRPFFMSVVFINVILTFYAMVYGQLMW